MSEFDAAKFIAEIISSNVENLFEVSKKFISDKNNQLKSRLSSTFSTYVENIERKYSSTKTIIYRDTPQSIKKFYEPIDLFNDKITIQNPTIADIKNLGRPVIITGTGGSGKSTFLKYLLLNSIEYSKLIPLFVELRNVEQENKSLLEFIYASLQLNKVDLGSEYLDSAFTRGNFLFLLDGFDELSPQYAQIISSEIDKISQIYSKCIFIITSRPGQEFISWSNFIELKTKPLTVEKAISLIKRLNYDQEIKENFIRELQNNLYDSHRSFFENPLLLSIMLITFRDSASIPSELHNFYALAFEALYYRHDASKTFKRPTLTNLPVNKGKEIMAAFSLITYINNQTNFSSHELKELLLKAMKLSDCECDVNELISDLLRAYCMLLQDGTRYQYTHRSFQEYFAACYLISANDINQTKLIQQFSSKADTDITLQLAYGMNPRMIEGKLIIPFLKDYKLNIGYENELTKNVFVAFAKYYFSSVAFIQGELSLSVKEPIENKLIISPLKALNLSISRLIFKLYNINTNFRNEEEHKFKTDSIILDQHKNGKELLIEEVFKIPEALDWFLQHSLEAKVVKDLMLLESELSKKYDHNLALFDSLLEDKITRKLNNREGNSEQ